MYPNKVAIFIHGIEPGVFCRIATALIRGFQEVGVSNCDLVVLNATEEEKALYPNINVVSLDVKKATYSIPPLVRYLREHKPDVIFPMPWYFNVISIWAKHLSGSHTKVVMGEHNIISMEAGIEHRQDLRLRYLPLVMRYTYSFGNGIVGVAQDVIKDLLTKVKVPAKVPMQVIHNPIDIEQIQLLSQEPATHPWFKNSDVPVILTAARLAKQKQLDVLIRAFANVVKVLPARLLILGKGPLKSDLENLCKELGIEEYVAFPGYADNPYSYMAACDAFVLASAWEGCPMVLEESFACGAAVIVNDAPGGSKDVVENGKYGIMVPNKDEQALAEAIIKILSQPELKLHYRKQARVRAQDFHYSKISQKYLDFASVLTA